jgi:hypothetical protein
MPLDGELRRINIVLMTSTSLPDDRFLHDSTICDSTTAMDVEWSIVLTADPWKDSQQICGTLDSNELSCETSGNFNKYKQSFLMTTQESSDGNLPRIDTLLPSRAANYSTRDTNMAQLCHTIQTLPPALNGTCYKISWRAIIHIEPSRHRSCRMSS